MKHYIFKLTIIALLASCVVGCQSKDNKNFDSSGWIGTFTNDTISLMLKDKSACAIITPEGSLDGEYVWDVDNTTILVTDRQSHLHLFTRKDNTLKTSTGSTLRKK